MDYDEDKVDKAVLALLYLTMHGDSDVTRAWKGHDWAALDRLYEKGMIGDPKSKAKSVVLTEEGRTKAEAYFGELFGKSVWTRSSVRQLISKPSGHFRAAWSTRRT